MEGNGNIQITPPQPVAVLTVALLPDGNVQVAPQGQINLVTLNAMLGAAHDLMVEQIKKAQAQGPGIMQAPAGLRFR